VDQLLPTPSEMAEWDRLSVEKYSLREELLMENAGREALHVLTSEVGPLQGRSVVLFAGPGNNGGDAFVLARHLANENALVLVLHAKPLNSSKGATAYHLALARSHDVPMVHLPSCDLDSLPPQEIIVDGLLGTGFSGELREGYLDWIRAINRRSDESFVLALDIPSGLDGTTGEPGPEAVRAHATVTFEEAKLGLFMGRAMEFTGRLHVRRIGIPKALKETHPPAHVGLTRTAMADYPLPTRSMHKGTAGNLLIVGGSRGLTGAPLLAGLAALRSGAGLVTVACPGGVSQEVKAGHPDVMTMPLGNGSIWTEACLGELEPELDRFDAVVLGPGLGRQGEVAGFVGPFLRSCGLPLLIDADGLYWLARDKSLLELLRPGTILTPHPGEMARLVDRSTPEVQLERPGLALELARRTRGVVVLKGAGTIVAVPDRPVAVSPFHAPTLAIGGSGDVLSGCIGSLLARDVDPLKAARMGVYWHGHCGLYLERTFPFRGNLAQEIAHGLPEALEELLHAHSQGHHDHGPDHLHPGHGGGPGGPCSC
jgi:ADP-dependent NAD(P)H-hydrate dehydratase / NAD(P)H-hydrate epimerase